MKTLMDKNKVKEFYTTYKWFAQFFEDLYNLLNIICDTLDIEQKNRKFNYYQLKKNPVPLLPDPYYVLYKNKNRQQKWKNVHLVSVCCPNEALENEALKIRINEPALIVIVTTFKNGADYWNALLVLDGRKIKKLKVDGSSFSGSYIDKYKGGGDFKGFFVPLYEFSKQALEQRSKEKNTTLEQALNDTIDELIVKRLERLLK